VYVDRYHSGKNPRYVYEVQGQLVPIDWNPRFDLGTDVAGESPLLGAPLCPA
jgi:hypothetical protein